MVETMRGRKGHQDQPDPHQDVGMTEKREEEGITVGLIGVREQRKSAETGERKGRKTLSQDLPVKDHGHQADVRDLQQDGHVPELVPLLEEGQEPAPDTMCQSPRLLLTFPPVT